jgi:hypothetical protein
MTSSALTGCANLACRALHTMVQEHQLIIGGTKPPALHVQDYNRLHGCQAAAQLLMISKIRALLTPSIFPSKGTSRGPGTVPVQVPHLATTGTVPSRLARQQLHSSAGRLSCPTLGYQLSCSTTTVASSSYDQQHNATGMQCKPQCSHSCNLLSCCSRQAGVQD